MSSRITQFLTNDHDEHCYKDCCEVYDNGTEHGGEAITLEFSKDNIRIEADVDGYLVLTITNVNSELYKIFEQIGTLATKEQK